MPLYLYQNPKTQKIVEVIQSCKEKHEYFDSDGVKYERVWTVPNASIDTRYDENSSNDFLDKVKNKRGGTVGDLWDKSAELSAKREKSRGFDPVKQAALDKYKKRTKKEHPHAGKRRTIKGLEGSY
jgi:hypothetical protein